MHALDVAKIRREFPALTRCVDSAPVVYFDGPAGSQVPLAVVDAVSHYLALTNANTHGAFVTATESDAMLAEAAQAVADLLGASDPDCIAFGPNMTTLTFGLSRAMARRWGPDDEIIVTRLDHDANVTPWVLAAADAGARVHHIPFHHHDTTLDLEALKAALNERTRLVAVGAASNATGSINPLATICSMAHDAGAEVFVDAVHYAPHGLIDVAAWDCDYLACSAYKFFGPHVGMLWGKRASMQSLPSYRVRPAGDALPGRWMTGTQNHEGIAGTLAAIDYLADLGRSADPGAGSRRAALTAAFAAIGRYEHNIFSRLLEGLLAIDGVQVYGITDPERASERCPTVSFTHSSVSPRAIAEQLGKRGIFVWDGNYYALELSEALGLEPDGMVRIGLLHYNTAAEVDRMLGALRSILG